jgi:hypothetical protein
MHDRASFRAVQCCRAHVPSFFVFSRRFPQKEGFEKQWVFREHGLLSFRSPSVCFPLLRPSRVFRDEARVTAFDSSSSGLMSCNVFGGLLPAYVVGCNSLTSKARQLPSHHHIALSSSVHSTRSMKLVLHKQTTRVQYTHTRRTYTTCSCGSSQNPTARSQPCRVQSHRSDERPGFR